MAFEWMALVRLARQLEKEAIGADEPEAHQRSAVGRAYFGAYGHARNYAKDFLEFEPREDADDHGRLRAHLKLRRRHGDAKRLERLRQWRNEADYLNFLPWLEISAIVNLAISEAEDVFRSLVPPKTA